MYRPADFCLRPRYAYLASKPTSRPLSSTLNIRFSEWAINAMSLQPRTTNWLEQTVRLLLVIAAVQLAGCSKTVQWDEEVPLNTGDTIWVKRSATYARSGAYANPLQLGWMLKAETLTFEWAGQKYEWEGDISLMALAIDPQHRPILVADADWNYRWGDRHHYTCVKPYYVQFVPKSPSEWPWLLAVEPWLYGVEANLMRYRTTPNEMPIRVSRSDRNNADADMLYRNASAKQINPNYIPDHCKGKE